MLTPITRRTALKGTAMALAGLPMVDPVSARSDTLAKELNSVRASTRKYKDIAVAQNGDTRSVRRTFREWGSTLSTLP